MNTILQTPFLVSDPHCFAEAICWGFPINAILVGFIFSIYRLPWSKFSLPMFLGLAILSTWFAINGYWLSATQNAFMAAFFLLPCLGSIGYILFYDPMTRWKYYTLQGRRKYLLQLAGWNVIYPTETANGFVLTHTTRADHIKVSKRWTFTSMVLGTVNNDNEQQIKEIIMTIGKQCVKDLAQQEKFIFKKKEYSLKELMENIHTLSPVGLAAIQQYLNKKKTDQSN